MGPQAHSREPGGLPCSANGPNLFESAKAAGVEPFAYLTDVMDRLPVLPAELAEEFTPRAWAASRAR